MLWFLLHSSNDSQTLASTSIDNTIKFSADRKYSGSPWAFRLGLSVIPTDETLVSSSKDKDDQDLALKGQNSGDRHFWDAPCIFPKASIQFPVVD